MVGIAGPIGSMSYEDAVVLIEPLFAGYLKQVCVHCEWIEDAVLWID